MSRWRLPQHEGARRAAAGAALCAAVLATCVAPAGAWVERYSFDDIPAFTSPGPATDNVYSDRGLTFDAGCGGYRIGGFGPTPFGPLTGHQAAIVGDLNGCSSPQFYLGWSTMPRTAQLWVRSPSLPRTILATDYTDPFNPVPRTYTLNPDAWTRIQLQLPTPESSWPTSIELKSPTSGAFLVDDIAVSDQPPGPPPATVVDEAPPATTESTSARVAFHNDLADPVFTCELDGVANACTSPWTRDGLGVGEHTLRIWATGVFGIQEKTPQIVKWTVTAPPPPPPPAPPLCPPGPDRDGDGVPDVCDTIGQPGTVPPASGESANVKVESGVVFIKLPAGVAGARAGTAATGGAVRAQAPPAPGSGYVSLKGNATVPVGSTVDARAGSITVTSATGASVKDGQAPPTASAKLSAAIFQIRQDRAKRAAGKGKKKRLPPNPTALILRSPEGAIAAAQCRVDRAGVIRSLSAVVPKGTFQFVGAAATVTTSAKIANVRTVDRCDGTFTEVGRGVATVTSLHRAKEKVVKVKAGRAYLMKGDFVSIEGRKGR